MLAVIVGLLTTTGQRSVPSPSPIQFGASVNRLFNDGTYTPAQIDVQLAALHSTGATIARSDALWEASEPAPPRDGHHHYDWSFDDRIAGALAAHGLRWLAILDYSAPWAESVPGVDHSPPADPANFAAYAAAFAARYGAGGRFWREHPDLPATPVDTFEIWNEPDVVEFWRPAPNPAAYADLYLQARAAIKAIDPRARVVVGGLAHPTSFLTQMVHARPELRGRIDGVGIHPYGADPSVVLARVADAGKAIASLGLGTVPVDVTEFGWTTNPPGSLTYVPERIRPGYIRATIAGLGDRGCQVAAVILYTWVTPDGNPARHDDWFGIASPHNVNTPDVRAFTAGVRSAKRNARAAGCGG